MLKRLKDLFKKPHTGGETEIAAAPPPRRPAPPPPVHRGPAVVHHPIPEVDLDPDAVKILKRLTRFDHTAYLVGGCVRDLLLERKPKDFDIGTSATPRQVRRLFSNCRIIGRRFRLAHVYFQNGKILEVATFRAFEGGNGDEPEGRPDAKEDLLVRDDNVFGTPEEDALRRDFTINQLFYDVNSGNVLDHAEGLSDLRRRLVRTIGDPEVRFREDPIRILRAIKFAARLDFGIEDETLDALRRTRGEIPKAASPRTLEEINRFCRGGAARRSFELMFETGVFEVVFTEIAEVYRDEGAREMLLRLLETLDAGGNGREVSTGEILAALFLPVVLPRLGWGKDGSVRGGRVPDLRVLADDLLRPLAQRLRVPRREQERCRQALSTLARMVPFRNVRKGARRQMPKRASFADALWLLRAAAAVLGGEVAASLEGWTGDAPDEAPRPAEAAAAPDAEGERKPRRRRRRRGRGKRGGEGDARETETAAARAPERAPERPPERPRETEKRPPVWSDDYFFAALPSVPDLGAAKDEGDRYGAELVAPTSDPEPEGEGAPRKRRRRRRRKAE